MPNINKHKIIPGNVTKRKSNMNTCVMTPRFINPPIFPPDAVQIINHN